MKLRTRLNVDPIAQRSLETLLEIAQDFKASGQWCPETSAETEVAVIVRRMFDQLAWSDRKFDARERRLFNALTAVHKEFGIAFNALHEDPCEEDFPRLPTLLRAALEHDRQYHTGFATLIVNSLENIGLAIVAADGVVYDRERAALKSHISNLRLMLGILA